MRRNKIWLAVAWLGLMALCLAGGKVCELPLEVHFQVPDFQLAHQGDRRTVVFAQMPPKPGKVRVLRGRFVSYSAQVTGCNKALRLTVNGTALRKLDLAGDQRMMLKESHYVFRNIYKNRMFAYWSDDVIELPFGPSTDAVDEATVGGDGSQLLLNIEDVAIGVDSNSLEIANVRRQIGDHPVVLTVEGLQVGYLDKALLPAPTGVALRHGGCRLAKERGGLRLEAGAQGGFAVRTPSSDFFLVETRLGMRGGAFELLAADGKSSGNPAVAVKESGAHGFVVEAVWEGGVALHRTLTLEADGLVHWVDEWRNGGRAIAGIPFRHRIRLAGHAARIYFAGNPETDSVPSPDANPTLVMLNRDRLEAGIGVTEENDAARLTGGFRNTKEGTEIFAAHLALAPGCRLALHYTVDGFAEGGYWKFINRVRRRWGIGHVTAPMAFFFGANYADAPGKEMGEKISNAFAHLGPVAVGMLPWRRNDHYLVREGKYPKLPAGAPRAPGKTPDLDIEEYLTFRHRRKVDEWLAYETRMIHKFAPEVKVLGSTHPAMETVYLPLQERWPYADCALRIPSGEIFHHPGYDRTHLWEYRNRDWVIGYYVPYSGSRYYDSLLDDIRRTLALGVDGFYIDEFSLGAHRDYCRYDYGRWDGFSADLDEDGKPVRLKSDVCLATVPLQLAALELVKRGGGIFVGNGSAATRPVNTAPALRFWEGASGFATTGGAHLSHVPMIYGNYGDEKTLRGVFQAARAAIGAGCLYSPRSCNLLLRGRDNFVCKQYPMTVVEIAPGVVVGRERLVSVRNGVIAWPGVPEGAAATVFAYDQDGNRVPAPEAVVRGGKIHLKVPPEGMVIAELKGK